MENRCNRWTLNESQEWMCSTVPTSSVLIMSLAMNKRTLSAVEGFPSFPCKNFIQGGNSEGVLPCNTNT